MDNCTITSDNSGITEFLIKTFFELFCFSPSYFTAFRLNLLDAFGDVEIYEYLFFVIFNNNGPHESHIPFPIISLKMMDYFIVWIILFCIGFGRFFNIFQAFGFFAI